MAIQKIVISSNKSLTYLFKLKLIGNFINTYLAKLCDLI